MPIASASEPDKDTYFRYEYLQKVDEGTGAYSGYTEETKGTGKYDVVSWGPTEVVMHARYSWRYSNNEGEKKSGKFNNQFSFSLQTRRYTSPIIDLDDPKYTSVSPGTLSQWLWIPPDIRKGAKISILNEVYTVTSKDKTLWSRLIPRKVIEVTVRGTYSRDDDYGDFNYDYTDKMYYDKKTGMFFAERYEEKDRGYWQSQAASFRYIIEMDVTESSYDVEIDWYTLVTIYSLVILTIVGLSYGIGYLFYRARYRSREYNIKDMKEYDIKRETFAQEKVKFRRIWKMKDYPHLKNNATDYFEPFLEHWTAKALLAKDRVAVAVSGRYGLMGFALYNKEAKIGTVLCRNTEITEILRGFIRCKDFFTENQHMISPTKSMKKNSTIMNMLARTKNEAYNIFETHTVYQLSNIKPTRYDPNLVRPMEVKDLPKVIKLAKKIFKGRAKRWIRASFKSGDLSYVAVLNGQIVGFGFACVCGTYGRLHTLGVAKEYRNRGIGKELHRARLEAMRQLNVTTVIDEIGDWNLASIRISTLSGFQKIGSMWVETVRRKRIKKNIIRR